MSASRSVRGSVLVLALLAFIALFSDALVSDAPVVMKRDGHVFVLPAATAPAALARPRRAGDWSVWPVFRTASRFRAGPATSSGTSLAWTIQGLRGALGSAAAVLILALGVGVPLGIAAGYASPFADGVLARLVELLGAWPTLVVVAVVWSARGHPDMASFVLVMGLLRAVRTARLVRGEILRVGGEQFVLAARAVGLPAKTILRSHILPHTLAPVLTSAAFTAAAVVGLEAALGYLGVDLPASLPSWGALLAGGGGPGIVIWPALAVILVTGSLYLIAVGLDDALAGRRPLQRAGGGL